MKSSQEHPDRVVWTAGIITIVLWAVAAVVVEVNMHGPDRLFPALVMMPVSLMIGVLTSVSLRHHHKG